MAKYRSVSIYDLYPIAADPGRVEARPYLGAFELTVPPLDRYGVDDMSGPDLQIQTPPMFLSAARGREPIVAARHGAAAFLIRNAVLHADCGIVSVDDVVIAESLYHLDIHRIPGGASIGFPVAYRGGWCVIA